MLTRIKYLAKRLFFGITVLKPVYIPVVYGNLLKKRVAIVTGGTRGIGYSIAKSYMLNGATVCITGRTKNTIDEACKKLKCETDLESVFGVEMDMADTTFEKYIDEIVEILKSKKLSPKIDILVNNAGINMGGFFGNVTADTIDKVIATNVRGVFLLSQVVAKQMRDNKVQGNILNIASSSSLRPAAWPYSVSKWSIRGLTLGMAKTLISDGIVVNGLAPGRTATSMQAVSEENGLELDSSLFGRMIDPAEIANMATILVSDLGRSIVGDIVYMTAGDGVITVDDIDYKFKENI